MKFLKISLITTTLTFSCITSADRIVAEEPDTILGKGAGGWVGFLIGGAAGGPFGALASAAIGTWAGGEIQESSGQAQKAYRVKLDNGNEKVVRSPNQTWEAGDKVKIVGNRIVTAAL